MLNSIEKLEELKAKEKYIEGNSIEEALEKLSTGKRIKTYEILRTFKREGIENFVITRKKYVDVILSDYKRVLKENEELTKACIQTAFDDQNNDTELLLRVLLKYGKIKLENGMYSRDKAEWEENITLLGFKMNREKTLFIEDDKLDEYTKQLEYKLNQLQKENEKLNEKILSNTGIYELGFRDGEKHYIQKITDKIEELKNEKEQLRIDNNVLWDSGIYKLDIKITALQELLEGED